MRGAFERTARHCQGVVSFLARGAKEPLLCTGCTPKPGIGKAVWCHGEIKVLVIL